MPLNGWVEKGVYFMESDYSIIAKNTSNVTVHLDQDLKLCTETGGDPMVTLQPGESWTMQKPTYATHTNMTSISILEPAIAREFRSGAAEENQKQQLDVEVATDGDREINLEEV